MFYQVHYHVCKGLEAEKQYERPGCLVLELVPVDNCDMHRQDTGIRKYHDGEDMRLSADIFLDVLMKGETMVESKNDDAREKTEDVRP